MTMRSFFCSKLIGKSELTEHETSIYKEYMEEPEKENSK